MLGATPSTLSGLPPVPALVCRTRWNHFRRWWKDLAWGRPEDQLHSARIDGRVGQPLLFLGIGACLILAPGAGRFVTGTGARLGLLVLTGLALLAATQLEAMQRAGRDSAIAGIRGILAASLAIGALAVVFGFGGASRTWLELWTPAAFLMLMWIALWDEPRASLAAGATMGLGLLGLAVWLPGLAGTADDLGLAAARGILWSGGIAAATGLSAALAKRGRDLRRTTHRDGLTQLLGRQAMIACLARESERSRRSGLPITLAMVHATGLHALRERHGSPFADAALCWLSSLVHESVRSSDLVARFGDDQIVLAFLDSADPVLLERLAGIVERAEGLELAGMGSSLAVKIGTGEFPADDMDIATVLSLTVERTSLASAGQVRSGTIG